MRSGFLVMACSLLFSSSLFAHGMLMTAKIEGERIRIEVFFDDDTPADEAKIEVFNTEGTRIAEGTSDDHGVWFFPKPAPGRYSVKATNLGHAVQKTLTLSQESNDEVTPTREEQTKTPWLKIFKGLGIISVLTLTFWMIQRKKG